MKNSNLVKILILIIVILSIGLINTIIKLSTINNIKTNNTPDVLDENSGVIVEEPTDTPIMEDNNVEDKVEEDKDIKDNEKVVPPKEEIKDNNSNKSDSNKNNKDKKDKDKNKEEKSIVKSKYISADEAIKIGVNKVGEGAELIKIESDLDDNPPKYELEIILGNYEYEIEIHAITGAVIDFEKDELD